MRKRPAMASACCVNNNVDVTPPAASKFSNSFAWLSPPRLSFTRDRPKPNNPKANAAAAEIRDDDDDDPASDFEFRLHDDPAAMLPADELISDGKLMTMTTLPKQQQLKGDLTSSGGAVQNAFSPRAPRCASRWREVFGLKNSEARSSNLKNFLHRKSKSSSASDAVGGLPLLRDAADCESLPVSSRLSHSSSCSGHDPEDFPRLSLDADKAHHVNPISLLKSVVSTSNNPNPPPPPRIRLLAKPRPPENVIGTTRIMGRSPVKRTEPTIASSYADSPRMNPAGKIVFHSLERSSSSPGSFNGGPRLKHRGVERSYSANVRVTPVLNVPVCSLCKSGNVLGFGQLFSSSNGGSSGRGYQSINNNSSSSRRNRS